jgi:hypothetical protein
MRSAIAQSSVPSDALRLESGSLPFTMRSGRPKDVMIQPSGANAAA